MRPSLQANRARPTEPRLPRNRPTYAVVTVATVLAVLLATMGGLLAMHLRARAMADAGSELQSMSFVLAEQAERAFEGIALTEDVIIERAQAGGLNTPDDFRQRMSGQKVHEDLLSRIRGLPQIDALSAVDVDGNLLNFTRYWPIPAVNVADRDYFRALRTDPNRTVFFSKPVRNRGDNSWTIYVAHKVVSPDGTFLGLILGAVSLTYLEQFYHEAGATSDASIALFLTDGTLLARYPHKDPRIGESFINQNIFKKMDDAHGLIFQHSLVDGEDRFYARHMLKHHPMMLTVSKTMTNILAVWKVQAAALAGATMVLDLAVAVAALLIIRQFRHQRLLHEVYAANAVSEVARVQNARFGIAMGNMVQAICMFDPLDQLVVANDRLLALLGLPGTSITPGTSFDALLALLSDPTRADYVQLGREMRALREAAKHGTATTELIDGRTLSASFQPAADQGWLLTMEDITERRRAEAKIQHMAHHDALTGLPNRVLFHEKLRQAIARGCQGDPCAVIYLDLDHFKEVNDTLGHPAGDELLRAVTARLHAQLRDTDVVARLGGDEFAIIQSGVLPADATALSLRLIDALKAPYQLANNHVMIGTSIGIALVPDDGTDADLILKNADMALYHAKSAGRGCYRFFEAEMDAVMQARRVLELDLRRALTADEFELFYQPLVHVGSGRVSAFEALIRWRHPERGMISPADFIPLSEEIGLIVPIGEWVLRRACAEAVTWPVPVKVSVNLSPIQLASCTLVQDVDDALRTSGLEPARLELEITETAMLEDTEATLAMLHRLRDLGVDIVMDDFGTGYSSLSYLRRFPFDKVKIDRSFVEGLGQGGDNDVIVRSIAELCNKLGMTTTAEGVETEEQLRLVTTFGCTEVQGYLFSRPRPAAEVPVLLRTLNRPVQEQKTRAPSLS